MIGARMLCETHIPSPNPRSDACCRCGKPMDSPVSPAVTPPAGMRRRNVSREREITFEAARGATEPSALIKHAETRAELLSGEYVPDSRLVRTGRDRVRDVAQEMADARNYCVWWLEEHEDDDWNHDEMTIALRFICLAYDRLPTI